MTQMSDRQNYSIEVKKTNNGFIVEESWNEKLDPTKEFSEYKSEKWVFESRLDMLSFVEQKF